MKPLEFKIEEKEIKGIDELQIFLIFYYEDGTTDEYCLGMLPKGLEINKHYSIADIYGYKIIDDRAGL